MYDTFLHFIFNHKCSILVGHKCVIWAATCEFQHCGILTGVDSDVPVQPPFKLRNSQWCLVSGLTVIWYSSDHQRLRSDCAYTQADLRLCWSHIPYCWKSHVAAHLCNDSLFRRWYRQSLFYVEKSLIFFVNCLLANSPYKYHTFLPQTISSYIRLLY